MLTRFASQLVSRASVRAVSAVAVPRALPSVCAFARLFATTHSIRLSSDSTTTTPLTSSTDAAADTRDAAVASNAATHIDNFEMSPPIRAALRQNFKIENLFPIQAECYNPIVEGKDLIGRSKTGSGKTLAFVLPLVQRLRQFPPLKKPESSEGRYSSWVSDVKCRVLILEPTRELANQVNMEILKLAHVRTAVLYGGAPAGDQMRALSRGSDIVVATPGRLLDMVQRGVLSLDEVKTVVLDEADEMLRMGFQEQVEQIMSHMQHQKQVLLFSATLPKWVNATAARYLRAPVTVDKVTGFENTTPSTITHKALTITRMLPDTAELIRDIFEQNKVARAIVFSRTKRDCGALADFLGRAGVRSRELHGDVPQNARDRTIHDFRAGRFQALIATDVAARGLDIANVDMVVNIGFPDDHAFYVHRSGRTGRAGRKGTSLLLYQQEERSKIHELTKVIGAKFEQMQFPTELNGKTYPRRSLLSAKVGFTTLEVRGRRVDAIQLEQQLRQISGSDHLTVGRIESGVDSSFVDVPNEIAQAVEAAIAQDPNASLRIATELPQEMFGGQRVNWQDKSSGGSRRGGSNGGRSFGGNRDGGFRRNGGDRDGGFRGGDRDGGFRRSGGDRDGGFRRNNDRDGGSRGFGGGDRGFGGDRQYSRGRD